MGGRRLPVLLAVSLIANAFLAAAFVSLALWGFWVARHPAAPALRAAARSLDAPHRKAFIVLLRADGRTARPQTQAARALRREVWADLQAPVFDAAADKAKLARARALNQASREIVEDGVVDYAATLPQDQRAALGRALLRLTPPPRPPRR